METEDYLFASERRYKTFTIKHVRVKIRIAREILKYRASFKEYNIDTKETLPENNIAYIDICLFIPSFLSIMTLKFYFSNFVNKITTIPIEINANPRRDHEPIVRMKFDSLIKKICKSVIEFSSTSKARVFAKNDTRDMKINPTIKKIIPIPNLIFPPFIQSSLKINQITDIKSLVGYL